MRSHYISGFTKRLIYYIVSGVLTLCAIAGVVLIVFFGDLFSEGMVAGYIVVGVFVVSIFLFPLHTFLHEMGHALAGWLCGMRVVALSVGSIIFDRRSRFTVRFHFGFDASGYTVVLPQKEKGARGKLLFSLIAGPVLDLIYGAVFLTLFFVLPHTPALIFFVLWAPFSILEGIAALIPVELLAGWTDGEFIRLLAKKRVYAMNALGLMIAQGMLYRGTYADLPEELVKDEVGFREDDLVYLARLQLCLRRDLYCNATWSFTAGRLTDLLKYVPKENKEEVMADIAYFRLVVRPDPEAAEKFRVAFRGKSAASLRAIAAFDPTEENIARAEKAAKKLCAVGERTLELELLARLKK